MTDARRIAFKLLKVHRGSEPDDEALRAASVKRAGTSFAQVLARHRSAIARPEARPEPDAATAALPFGAADETDEGTLALELDSRIADALNASAPEVEANDEGNAGPDEESSADEERSAGDEKNAHEEPRAVDRHSAVHARTADGRDAADEPVVVDRQAVAEPPAVAPAQRVQAITPAAEHNMAVARYLADTVARFCGDPAVAHGEGWQVQIALDADILRDTTLHLSLSPHWLTLRFVSTDRRSRDLVLQHQDVLEQMLTDAVVPRRDIAISAE